MTGVTATKQRCADGLLLQIRRAWSTLILTNSVPSTLPLRRRLAIFAGWLAIALAVLSLLLFLGSKPAVPLLRITDRSHTVVGYLVPSMHFGLMVQTEASPALRQAIHKAPRVFFELDTENAADVARAGSIFKPLGERQDFEGAYPAALHNAVLSGLSRAGVAGEQAQQLLKLHPFVLINVLESVCYRAVRDKGRSVDDLVRQLARDSRKPTGSTDDPQHLVNALARYPKDAWVSRVESALKFSEAPGCSKVVNRTYDDIAKAYVDSDFDRLLELGRQQDLVESGNTMLFDAMIDSAVRNAFFARQIASEILTHRGSVFVIGAAHFGGDDAIPKLLETMGFSIER